jgi:hypothetical protein
MLDLPAFSYPLTLLTFYLKTSEQARRGGAKRGVGGDTHILVVGKLYLILHGYRNVRNNYGKLNKQCCINRKENEKFDVRKIFLCRAVKLMSRQNFTYTFPPPSFK